MSADHEQAGPGWLRPSGSRPAGPPRPDGPPVDEDATIRLPAGPTPATRLVLSDLRVGPDEPTVPLRAAGRPRDADPTPSAVPVPAGVPGAQAGSASPSGEPDPARPDLPSATEPSVAEPSADRPAAEPAAPVPPTVEPPADRPVAQDPPPRRRISSAGATIAVLLLLLGFTMAVQLKNNSTDSGLTTARQEDLVRILSDLENSEERLRQEISGLEESQRQLTSGAEGRQAALAEATRRGDELGILAGTLPARGPGLSIMFSSGSRPVKAAAILDAVQELRGAGAEAMQITGGDGASVRIVATTYFLDADGRIEVAGRRLPGPYTITVVGDAQTMRTALNIPGGVVASVSGDGGNVTIQERGVVDVTALSPPINLQYARPAS